MRTSHHLLAHRLRTALTAWFSRLTALLLLPALFVGSIPACVLALPTSRESTFPFSKNAASNPRTIDENTADGAAMSDVHSSSGILIANSGGTYNTYLCTKEPYIRARGLYYLRARLMNPLTGRFWSADSYEGDSDDPASLHKYLYANNDPVNNLDPSGHLSLTEITVVAAIIGVAVGITVTSIRGVGPDIENGKFSDYFVQGLYHNGGIIAVTVVGLALGIEWGGAPIPKVPGEFALGTKPGYKDITTRLSRLNVRVMEWLIKEGGNSRANFKVLRFIGYIFRNIRAYTNPAGAFAAGYVSGMIPSVAFLAAERARD